jgi:hypothetical protein
MHEPHLVRFGLVFTKRSNSSRLTRQARPILKAPGSSCLLSTRYTVTRETRRSAETESDCRDLEKHLSALGGLRYAVVYTSIFWVFSICGQSVGSETE